jgi:hypothetical protein
MIYRDLFMAETRMGQWRYSPPLLTSALDGGEWAASGRSLFTPFEISLGPY